MTDVLCDGRPGFGAAIGVLPVCRDDPTAPYGSAALRLVRGRRMLGHWVEALLAGGATAEVVVAASRSLAPEIADLLHLPAAYGDETFGRFTGAGDSVAPGRRSTSGPDGQPVRVLGVDGTGVGDLVLAVLEAIGVEDRLVVVQDPGLATTSSELVARVLDTLRARVSVDGTTWSGAVSVLPVTDTLKCIDDSGVIVGTVDREGFRRVAGPQAYRLRDLQAVLTAASAAQLATIGPATLPLLVVAAGQPLALVPPAPASVPLGEEDLASAGAP